MLRDKLSEGNAEEKQAIVVMLWALSANNQRAKLLLKTAGLLEKLEEFAKALAVFANSNSKEVLLVNDVIQVLNDEN